RGRPVLAEGDWFMDELASDHDEFCAQGAGLFQRFENRDEIAGCCADAIDGLDDFIKRGAGREQEHARVLLRDFHRGVGEHDCAAFPRERRRLARERLLADRHDQRTVRDRRGSHGHVGSDDDGAGARIDDDLGRGLSRVDFEILEVREERSSLRRIRGRANTHGYGIGGERRTGAERVVDQVGQPACGREVRLVQVQDHRFLRKEIVWDGAFYRGAVRYAPGAGNVDRHLRAVGTGSAEAADDEVTLCKGVDVAVRAAQRRHQQAAATQALRVADRGNRDVDRLPRFREWRKIRLDRNGGNVLELQVDARRNRDTELRKHVLDALHGEGCLAGLVTRAVEADDEAITHQLVVAHPGDAGKVLDPVGERMLAESDDEYREPAESLQQGEFTVSQFHKFFHVRRLRRATHPVLLAYGINTE